MQSDWLFKLMIHWFDTGCSLSFNFITHNHSLFYFSIQAFSMRPSIIFFDEIDGLAPVRSSRQDQIHSSIVSTLLALMDGLDSRGEIVVIGATNRIDAIDPALRRPGRFDREFQFALPDRNVGSLQNVF